MTKFIKNTTKVSAITVAASVMLLAGAVPALAADSNAHKPSLIDRIASAFHLNHDDVQKQVQDFRAEKKQDRKAKFEDRLNQAVKEGKITEAQKTVILQKADDMKSFMESLKGKSPQERRNALKAKHDELVQWAKDNGIPAPFDQVGPMGNGFRHGHPGTMHQ